jgi:hypothetical protein
MSDAAPTADPSADPTPSATPAGPAGRAIRVASWAGTAVFTITAVAAAIDPHILAVLATAVVVAGVLFFAGIAIFFWAYLVAVNRSRTDLIGMGGLFFLAGSAPRAVQWSLLGSLAVQVAVGLGTALAHPFTPLAFGLLAWMYGLALCGLWAARYGTFPSRPPHPEKRRGRGRGRGTGSTASGAAPAKTDAKGGTGSKSRAQASAGAKSTKRGGGRTTPKGGKPKSRSSYL